MRRQDERGLLSTELAILMPVMLVLALLAVFMSHVERHSSRAQQAADAAARSASYETNEADAYQAAVVAAERVCAGIVVIERPEGFAYQPAVELTYTPGTVSVSLSCTEEFSAFAPLATSTRTERGEAVAAVEYWRPGT